MAYSVNFKADVELRHLSYSTREAVQLDISDREKNIEKLKGELFALICATPKDITGPDSNSSDPYENMQMKFNEIWEQIEDEENILVKLYLLDNEDAWKTKIEG